MVLLTRLIPVEHREGRVGTLSDGLETENRILHSIPPSGHVAMDGIRCGMETDHVKLEENELCFIQSP